jgi:hypothetical protein
LIILGGHKKLGLTTDLYCDNVKVSIPPHLRGLIVINIDSYAGGSKLWDQKWNNFQPQQCNDGLVEVRL